MQFTNEQMLFLKKLDHILKCFKNELISIFPEVNIDVSLAGGSIRDLIFNKQELIKDLDIVFNVQKKDTDIIMLQIKKEFGEDCNEFFFKPREEDDYFLKSAVITPDPLIAPKYTIQEYLKFKFQEKYKIKNSSGSNYFGTLYVGLVQIEDYLGFPMDVLIMDHEDIKEISLLGTQFFIERNFDFNICKVLYVPEHSDLRDNVLATPDFLNDFWNRKITLNPRWFTPKQIKYALETHLPRFKYKYPDFKVDVIGYDHIKPDMLEYMRNIKDFYNFDVLLPEAKKISAPDVLKI